MGRNAFLNVLAVCFLVSLFIYFARDFGEVFQSEVALPSPGFLDVSAFGEREVAQVDAWLRQVVDMAAFPSLSVAVVRDGTLTYQAAFGFEDIEAGRKATVETSYHVASVTKVFTTLLALLLQTQGVVDLDQPATKYLPATVPISSDPEVGATITLRQLATHTSGLPRGIPGRVQTDEGRYALEPERLYQHLSRVRLVSKPGTEELYSNLGMGLLGHVLELAAGRPYEELIEELICEPLGLERTAVHPGEEFRVALGYGVGVPRRPVSHSYRERLAPSGGLIASVPDLAKFLGAHMQPGFLSREILAEVFSPAKLSDGSKLNRSLGWSFELTSPIGMILQKNGGRSNCTAWIGFAPLHGVGVAVAANCGAPSVDEIGLRLLERSIPGGFQLATENGYAKAAPFTGVRWEGDRPVVRVDDRWSALVSINGVTVERILEFAEGEYGDRAQKRFAEDLVEVLSKMGLELDWEVTLGLETSDEEVELKRVRMTEENRERVRQ